MSWARQFNPKTRTTEAARAKLVMPWDLCIAQHARSPIRAPAGSLWTFSCTPTSRCSPGSNGPTMEPGASCTARLSTSTRPPARVLAQAEWRDRLVRELGISTVVGKPGEGLGSSHRRHSRRWALCLLRVKLFVRGARAPAGHRPTARPTGSRWCRRARASTSTSEDTSPSGGSAPRASGSMPPASRPCSPAPRRHRSRAGSTWSAAPSCSASVGSPLSTRRLPVATHPQPWPRARPSG